MAAGLMTPMLDFFRRGEVARDVKLLAAQGAIAPRPLEQLGILMVLTSDGDSEIRQTAERTLAQIPANVLASFIARADVPTELREFFIRRGVEPSATPAPDTEEPLVDSDDSGLDLEGTDEEKAQTFQQRLGNMTVPEKVKCATKGTREMRAILIRDPNRMVSAAVLSCPKVNEAEVEAFAKMGTVSEDILDDRDDARLDQELRRAAGAGEELEDTRGAVAEHDAAAQRFRREEAVDRPERAGGPPPRRPEARSGEPEVAPTPPRDAWDHSERICESPSM
jgi:hypothetical protein